MSQKSTVCCRSVSRQSVSYLVQLPPGTLGLRVPEINGVPTQRISAIRLAPRPAPARPAILRTELGVAHDRSFAAVMAVSTARCDDVRSRRFRGRA